MGKKLLIVESPAKAKTIGKYLGGEFTVKSSVGHIRDLPKENGAIKIVEKGPDKWEFVPSYVDFPRLRDGLQNRALRDLVVGDAAERLLAGDGPRTSLRCQAIASPSRSGSLAR